MKKVTDLKENECIHCSTKEEFKAILELNPDNNITLDRWNLNKKNTVYYPFRHRRTGGFADLKYANEEFNSIHPASDFLEPTYQLNKSQIIAIAENGSLVKELFPECFEVELEVGKWYKSKHYLVNYLGNNKCNGFYLDGMSYHENLNHTISSHIIGEYKLASEEEVTEPLKEEKRKRYKLHTDNIKWLSGEPIETLKGDLCYFEDNKLYASGGSKRWCLFDNGKWAEICKEPKKITISEIENILGYSIEIVK